MSKFVCLLAWVLLSRYDMFYYWLDNVGNYFRESFMFAMPKTIKAQIISYSNAQKSLEYIETTFT